MTEIIVVIGIVGMILALAVPYFGEVMRRARLDSEARGLDMALLKARLEAIKRGTNVNVMVSTNPSANFNAKDLSGGTITVRPYENNLFNAIMYLDSDADGSLGTSETVLAQYPSAPASSSLSFTVANYCSTGCSTPSASATTFNFVFTPFGSSTSSGSSKAVFVSDSSGNVLQVGIPVAASGKVAMTKLSGTSYVPPPWSWN